MSRAGPLRQPLGDKTYLNKFLEETKDNGIIEQTRRLTIIYAKSKLQVQIPINWSINKVKCMLIIHFQMLNFDKFQFQSNKFLVSGKTLVANLPSDELIVTQAQCPKAFENYYKQTMNKMLKTFQINTESSLYPILHKSLSYPMRFCVSVQRQKNLEQIPANRLRRPNEQQGVRVINIIRLIGIIAMSNLIFSLASLSQIAILVGIALVYLLMDHYVNQNERNRRLQQRQQRQVQREEQRQQRQQPLNQPNQRAQNIQKVQNQQQQQPQKKFKIGPNQNQIKQKDIRDSNNEQNLTEENIIEQELKIQIKRNPMRAKMTLWLAFTVEAIYCYFLSVFPNWTVKTHLHANQQKMDIIMDNIKELDPEASQMVKNWKKQENKQQKPKNVQ